MLLVPDARMMSAALVLCGGHSRRMGRSKAWLPFGTETLLQRVVRLAGVATSPVVVVAARGQDLPALPSAVRIVRDAEADCGPLQGMLGGMQGLDDSTNLVYVTTTDAPFLAPGWIARLVDLSNDEDDRVVPVIAGRPQPLASLYRRRTVLPEIARQLAAGNRRVQGLGDGLNTRFVSEDELRDVDPEFQSVRNLNTPEEYEAALRLIPAS